MRIDDSDGVVNDNSTGIVQNDDGTEYINYYRHDDCPETPPIDWTSVWTAMCDDECPACGADITPYKSEIVGENGTVVSDKEPECGWHDANLFSVSYRDIEVLIDRQIAGEVEIRVWRNGVQEDFPYALMTFET